MPFDEEEPKEYKPKVGLKQIDGQKSMFDGKPRKPSPQAFQQRVQAAQDTLTGHKKRAAELFTRFSKMMGDKTLPQNRNLLQEETENEILQNLIQLGMEINRDEIEADGMGSLTLITVLLKACVLQRDKINQLEYNNFVLQKKLEPTALSELIKKEITAQLDKQKKNE